MKLRVRLLLTTAIAALSLAAFLGSCKKDDFVQIDSVCPVVLTTDPANLATSVALNKVITINFNEKWILQPLRRHPLLYQLVTQRLQEQ